MSIFGAVGYYSYYYYDCCCRSVFLFLFPFEIIVKSVQFDFFLSRNVHFCFWVFYLPNVLCIFCRNIVEIESISFPIFHSVSSLLLLVLWFYFISHNCIKCGKLLYFSTNSDLKLLSFEFVRFLQTQYTHTDIMVFVAEWDIKSTVLAKKQQQQLMSRASSQNSFITFL